MTNLDVHITGNEVFLLFQNLENKSIHFGYNIITIMSTFDIFISILDEKYLRVRNGIYRIIFQYT